jgi:pyrimidine 5'-nucleotidase
MCFDGVTLIVTGFQAMCLHAHIKSLDDRHFCHHTHNTLVVLVAVPAIMSDSTETPASAADTTYTVNPNGLTANESICLVDAENAVIGSMTRAQMRRENAWHRATYVLVRHEALHVDQHGDHPSDVHVLVQRRSMIKDYCPGKYDPTPGGVVGHGEDYAENAVRELKEEMGIDVVLMRDGGDRPQEGLHDNTGSGSATSEHTLVRKFTFPYQDERVKVWGDFYECTYRGALRDLTLQTEEVDEVIRMSLEELRNGITYRSHEYMPDACHALQLYFQHLQDVKVQRKLLQKYSSSNLQAYGLRPPLQVLFFDCDDCLYFDGWKTARLLTSKIDEWCIKHGLQSGQAYQLYKQYGTALRGLLAEGHLEESQAAIDGYLQDVHDIPLADLIQRDDKLREMLLKIDPSIPKYIFTASVRHHAERCLKALGIEDLFDGIIDCKDCGLETKHSHYSFEMAMKIAKVTNPQACMLLDDNLNNLRAAHDMGWRAILVGKVGRDCGQMVTSDYAELEIGRIHDLQSVLPEIFVDGKTSNSQNDK